MFLLLSLIGPLLAVFTETSYKYSIGEDSTPGTPIGKIPLLTGIDYRFSGLPEELRIENGEIFLSGAVDRERTPNLSFSLISSSPPAIIHALVNILDVNDNSPSFPLSFQNLSVLETAPKGTRLPILGAIDPDEAENGKIRDYRLLGEEIFELMEEEGLIFLELVGELDREHKQLYSYNLTAQDGGNPSRAGWTSIYVQVLDVNDCAPFFEERRIVSTWNGKVAEPLAILNATDGDEGENASISYDILGRADGFEILGNELYSKVENPVCCESPPCRECLLVIKATDKGNPPLSSTVEVLIKFQGENQHDPEIQIRLQPSHVDFAVISPSSEAGKALAVLTATDEDGPFGDSGYLKILNDTDGFFQLQEQPGFWILRLGKPGAEFIGKRKIQVIFEASDGQIPARNAQKGLTVYVEGQMGPERKKKVVHQTARILEDSPKGSFVTQVGINSTGQKFKIANETELLPVEIDEINGIVTTKTANLVPGRISFDISVFPPPPAVQPYLVTIELLIEDVNNNYPEIIVPEIVKIPENAALDREILKFEVQDKDLGKNGKTFVILANGGEYVKLEKDTLILKKKPGFVKEKGFQVVLEAVDQGNPPLSARKRINFHITNSSNSKIEKFLSPKQPKFEEFRLEMNISAKMPLGSELARLEACKEEESCIYSTDCPFLTINPENGILTLARIFKTDKMVCNVVARDERGRDAKMEVIIRKDEENENFRLPAYQEFFISPELPLGTLIGKLPFSKFHIYSIKNPETIGIFPDGVLYIRRNIEALEVYSFEVDARHRRLGNRYKAEVWVRVENSQVQDVKCPKSLFKIKENNNAGATAGFLEGYKPSTKIRQVDNHSQVLITSTGRIIVLNSLDAEKVNNLTVKVEISHRKEKKQCQLVVEVDDENEYAPKFEESFYRASLPFGTVSGSAGTVKAVDLDSSQSNVTYKLLSNKKYFKLNSTTGSLSYYSQLPSDSVLNVSIRATDSGSPPLHSDTFFLVKTAENPNPDVFFFDNSIISIPPTAKIASIIGRLRATAGKRILKIKTEDPRFLVDSQGFIRLLERPEKLEKQFQVVFSTDGGNQTKKFEVTDGFYRIKENMIGSILEVPSTSKIALISPPSLAFTIVNGNLTAVQPLDREEIDNYQILLENQGSYSLLNIEVEDEPDSLPHCGTNVFLLGDFPSTLKLNCSSPDLNSILHYSLKSSFDGIIFRPNGEITVESLEEVVNHLEVQLSNRQFKTINIIVTLIKNKKDNGISFPAETFNLLLSSSLKNGESFGRVAADSENNHLEYFLLGEDSLTVDNKSAELMVLERNEILKDPKDREVELIAASRAGISSVKVNIEIVEDSLHLQKKTFVFEAKSRILGELLGELDLGRKDLTLEVKEDSRFFIKGRQLFLKQNLMNNSKSLIPVAVEVRKGRVSSKIVIYVILPPLSANKLIEFKIPENLAAGTIVGEVPEGYTEIIGEVALKLGGDGILRTTEVFDREKVSAYNFTLKNARGAELPAIYQIEDENDNFPILERQKTEIQVSEDLEPGVALTRIRFSDPDSNDHFQFSIIEGNEIGPIFEIDSWGLLTLKGKLDYELKKSHLLKIQLTDGSPPFKYHTVICEVLITVIDVNDTPPRLTSPKSFSVQENSPLATVIGSFSVKDPDSLFISYRILPESLPAAEFLLDPIYGYLTINKNLDYEKQAEFNFWVEISDGELKTREKITVTVLDLNDNPPRFQGNQTIFTVDETVLVGHTVASFKIEDFDGEENSRCLFWLKSGSKLFQIGESSGILRTAGKLDYEAKKEHFLTVYAINIAEGTGIISRNVTVNLQDSNDESPQFLKGSPQILEIFENLPGPFPMVISNSVSEDSDKGDTVAYSLLSGNGSIFSVDSKNGDIFLLKPLDREEQEEHGLIILASDSGRPRRSSQAEITIHVLDHNDNFPQFLQPYYRTKIREDAENGMELLRITAEDRDFERNSEISYKIIEKDTPFWINPHSGRLILRGRIDWRLKNLWDLTIEAKDNGKFQRRSSRVSVRITVEKVFNSPPVIRNTEMDVFIDGKMKKGETIHVIDAFDPDDDLLLFSLSGPDSSNFEIFPTGEIISLLPSLFLKSFYTITVTAAEDAGGKTTAATFTFYVDDTTFPHFFPISSIEIPENTVEISQNTVFNASSSKPAPFYNVQYCILAGNDDTFAVGLQNGVLSLLKPLDREKKDFYRIWVRATDSDSPPKSSIQSLEIKVLDKNDEKPEFKQVVYHAKLKENSQPELFRTVEATDKDLGPNGIVSYRISQGNEDSLFSIDRNGGIRTLQPLDRERAAEHRLTVVASDGGFPPLEQEALVVVEVEDEDDNSPKFTKLFHAEIPEDLPIGSAVILVSATDNDSSNSHNFSLEEESDTFKINRTTGWITLAGPLDRERISSYRLRIRLDDGVWTIFTSVQVTILDVNDNRPLFEKNSYIFMAETLGKVLAHDLDEGENGRVLYSLMEDSPYIFLNSETGLLKIIGKSPRDYEKVSVIARDFGLPSLFSSTSVWILFSNFRHLPPLTVTFLQSSKLGETIWKLPNYSKSQFVLSSEHFNLTNENLILKAANFPPREISLLGTVVNLKNPGTIQTLAVVLLKNEPQPFKFRSKTTRLLIKEEIQVGSQLGSLEMEGGPGWKKFTLGGQSRSEIITINDGKIILKEELEEPEYNLTVIVENLDGIRDRTQLLLIRDYNPASDEEKEEKLEEEKIFKSPEDFVPFPMFQSIKDIILPDNQMLGTRLKRIDKPENCSIEQISRSEGYCISNDFLIKCKATTPKTKGNQLLAAKVHCSNGSVIFLDLNLAFSALDSVLPRIISIRENVSPQKIAKLQLEREKGERLTIFEEKYRKIFAINENSELSSLIPLDREEKSFYSIPVRRSTGQKYTVRVLVDDVLDSPSLLFTNFSVIIFSKLKTPTQKIQVHPASLDSVHNFRCKELDSKQFEVSSGCLLSLRGFPDSNILLQASKENSSIFNYKVSFSQRRLRLLKLDSTLRLKFFGSANGIAAFLSGLHSNFPDLKFYPAGISSKTDSFYDMALGIADRHDRMVSIPEAKRVIDSFLTSYPVLELISEEIQTSCRNYSMRMVSTEKHLPFRGIDTIWLLPEGKIETRCIYEDNPLEEASLIRKIERKPEICSRKTCPDGICSIEDGRVTCLRGENIENGCNDPTAISFASGHLELLPTSLYHLLLQKNSDCNDSSISLEFRTTSDGTLVSLENKHGFRSSLEIVKGVPVYKLSDAYRSPVEIPLTWVVTDGEWHSLIFKMMENGRKILLEVDRVGREARTKTNLPLALADDLKKVQIGAGSRQFVGCIRRFFFNEEHLPLHGDGSRGENQLPFSISAVGHLSWSSGSSSSAFRLSPTSVIVLAVILALLAVICSVYCFSRLYFRWKDRKRPAWQETEDINAITVRHPTKKVQITDSPEEENVYDVAERVRKAEDTELCSFERAPTLPVRQKVRTVADVTLQIPRTSTPKSFYRNDGYV